MVIWRLAGRSRSARDSRHDTLSLPASSIVPTPTRARVARADWERALGRYVCGISRSSKLEAAARASSDIACFGRHSYCLETRAAACARTHVHSGGVRNIRVPRASSLDRNFRQRDKMAPIHSLLAMGLFNFVPSARSFMLTSLSPPPLPLLSGVIVYTCFKPRNRDWPNYELQLLITRLV